MVGDDMFSILQRLIDPEQGNLSAAAAEAVLQLQFSESDQARMTELAAKSNEGILTPAEGGEYDGYIVAADVLSIWKSKARLSMRQHPSAA